MDGAPLSVAEFLFSSVGRLPRLPFIVASASCVALALIFQAVTPDALGDAWKDGKLHLPLYSMLNKQLFGKPNAGRDMTFDFGTLIAHAAKTRPLVAGSIISNRRKA